jgi:glycerol-3-phosphate dehydrogenase
MKIRKEVEMTYKKENIDHEKIDTKQIYKNISKELEQKLNPWGYSQRSKSLEKIEKSFYDILIVGGGITGAGIAREAAIKGLKFCLIDKNDFAFGTSSKSSKLAHGGFRYLANAEFKLVRESTTERNWLYKAFSNLVRPVGFVLTAYEDSEDTLKKIKIGVKLYDFISNFLSKYKSPEKHKFLSAEEIKKLEPAVKQEGLSGGAIYYDTNIDDSRLTIETIKDALAKSNYKEVVEKDGLKVALSGKVGQEKENLTDQRSESVALSYCRFLGFADDADNFSNIYFSSIDANKDASEKKENRKGNENKKRLPYRICYVQDQISGITYTIKTKIVINATGIWNDEILKMCKIQKSYIRPTKGVHLVIRTDRLGNNNAFGLRSIDDKRFFFVLRRDEFTYIGTTDTDFNEDIEEPVCNRKDCDYLLNTVNFIFPKAHLTYKDIVATYAGVRPLVNRRKSESSVSRKHVIIDHRNNFVSICGENLQFFRKMAEELFVFL